ncbi:putative glycosyltransferase [Actinoplanes sp. SE50]|uniref:glycosyltransferase family 2 protein n=1 Tax=unclassified Actinoplanes TaxID=2626549 RepID=UPI00023EBBD9|nr:MULTISPECIES: glycosyltransferase [unclassified Actinoplanes]AEV85694.1 putative glycosyltransferase [Actinoplanes sp. SE50/110]ATO84087.1 putative glycosyltransferase [Actinoplanes sp. SE50]SLM01497.1 glycosyl transferase [Actinoplanes sp. SE50/110]
MTRTPALSVVVPAFNSAALLREFLTSFLGSTYRDFEIIVNDDVRSADETPRVVAEFRDRGLDVRYLKENRSMAQGRRRGAAEATGEVLLHLDTDMMITPGLLGECADLLAGSYDAVVIPEESFGTTFWARCKWLEKKCYDGVAQIESLRCLRRDVYDKLGGHDERMVFSEDKDLDLRVRAAGCRVGRTRNFLYHNEGDLRLSRTLRKKLGYAATADVFARVHPEAFRWQANILHRLALYLRNARYLRTHPLLYGGMWLMKISEFAFGAIGHLRGRALATVRPAVRA